MHQLTAEQVSLYTEKFKQAAPPTSSSGNPRPEIYQMRRKKDLACLVGHLDMFGIINKYYYISSQSDIDALIQACRSGASMDVKWYYLTTADMDPKDLEPIIIHL